MCIENDKSHSGRRSASLPLAPESPVTLIVDGRPIAVLMCTPYDLDELAVGHLLSRGIIKERGDLSALSICPDMRSVKIKTATGAGASIETEGVVYSACGAARVEPRSPLPGSAGTAAALPGDDPAQVASEWAPGLDEIAEWARAMFAAAELYRKTGGLHVAALACKSQNEAAGTEKSIAPGGQGQPLGDRNRPAHLLYFVVREDVGRHNAVDKALGRGLLDRVDFSRSVILTSGRIAADMIQKAARAGVPILVSRSIPTTEAYAIALEVGITLVGRIGSANPIVYTRPDRIVRTTKPNDVPVAD